MVSQHLSEAREKKQTGDMNRAYESYEKVYNNPEAEEPQKIEALEFLCEKSCEKGDKTTINEIMEDVK